MSDIDGESIAPSEIVIPSRSTGEAPHNPVKGMLYFNTNNSKLVVWTGSAFEVITSA